MPALKKCLPPPRFHTPPPLPAYHKKGLARTPSSHGPQVQGNTLARSCTKLFNRFKDESARGTSGREETTTACCVILDHVLRFFLRFQPQFFDLVCTVRDHLFDALFMTAPESCREFMETVLLPKNTLDITVPEAEKQVWSAACLGGGLGREGRRRHFQS